MFRRTLTDSRPPVVLAEGALATRVAGARVKVAVGVRVSSVVGTTLANSVAENITSHNFSPDHIIPALTFQTRCNQH